MEGSRQEMAGKGPDRRYPETVLEPLGSNSLSNRNIFIGFDVMNVLAKSVKLGLPRIFS